MLRDIRKQYEFASLNKSDVDKNVFIQLKKWLDEAINSLQLEPTAMILSTVDIDLQPHSRIVLLKDFDNDGLVFFSNYESNKANQLNTNNRAAVLFFWETLERQVRITGTVEKLSEQASVEYFMTRPLDSKLGAWASPQSRKIENKAVLEQSFEQIKLQFKDEIPKPPHWGGYRIRPKTIEFWQGRPNRLHDRILYSKQENDNWTIERLAP